MPTSSPVLIDSHAIATLRYIRASMDAAATVAVPGSAGLAVGSIGVLATALALSPALHTWWLLVWLVAAPVAATAGGLLLSRQFALRGFTWLGAPVRKVALCLLPGLFAGGVLTVVEWKAQQLHAIPGTWLLLYGCALVCTSAMTSKLVGVLGGLFGALALVAFWVPDSMEIVVLGLGFGGLHLGFGVLTRRRDHDDKS
jgi:hypothetical protein